MAKWWLTEQQCRVVDECLQLHGGYGYMREYPIARMYADARVQRIYARRQRDHEGADRPLPVGGREQATGVGAVGLQERVRTPTADTGRP